MSEPTVSERLFELSALISAMTMKTAFIPAGQPAPAAPPGMPPPGPMAPPPPQAAPAGAAPMDPSGGMGGAPAPGGADPSQIPPDMATQLVGLLENLTARSESHGKQIEQLKQENQGFLSKLTETSARADLLEGVIKKFAPEMLVSDPTTPTAMAAAMPAPQAAPAPAAGGV